MTVEAELREVFAARAATVVDSGLPTRTGAVRRRAGRLRRQQVAGAVGGVALVCLLLVLVSLSVVPGLDSDAVDPAVPPGGGTVEIPRAVAGRTLIDSAQTEYGQLTFAVDAERGSEWLMTCSGVGPEFTLHRTLDGAFEETAPCGVEAGLRDGLSFRFAARAPASRGHGGRVLSLWVTRTSDGSPVSPEGAVLAAAVYELPPAEVFLAESDVLPIELDGGDEWRIVDYGQSALGATSYTKTFPPHADETMLELLTAGSGDARVLLLVDGVRIDTVPNPYLLGAGHLGERLSAGKPHTVTLRIEGEPPADAQLAIVRREPVS